MKKTICVSACLLNDNVRYDGEDKRNAGLMNELSHYFNILTICPEMECGFGVPREPVILLQRSENKESRFVTKNSNIDYTDKIVSWSLKKIDDLKSIKITAFVFKSKSPSCGINSNFLFNEHYEICCSNARGKFAELFIRSFDNALCVEETDLSSAKLLKQFINKVLSNE